MGKAQSQTLSDINLCTDNATDILLNVHNTTNDTEHMKVI